jgi:hypothetical protein
MLCWGYVIPSGTWLALWLWASFVAALSSTQDLESSISATTIPTHRRQSLMERLDPRNNHVVLRGGNADMITGVYHDELQELIASLKQAFGIDKVSQLADTLAVMILFYYSFEQPFTLAFVRRLSYLHCSLLHLTRNVAPHTNIDVYVWVPADDISRLPPMMFTLPGVIHIVPVPKSSWLDPWGTEYNEQWNFAASHSRDYYLMGRWRNTFAFSFVKEMGYQYMLQLDDDTFISDPIEFDMVKQLRAEDCVVGVRSVMVTEPEPLVAGLPELVRYWMLTRNFTTPIGPLYERLTPPNISGLYTGGWDRGVMCTCFLVIDVHFWFQEVVQDFVSLILKTGADVEQRWIDQDVENMVLFLFVPWDNVFIFGARIFHSKVQMECIADLGCGSSLRAVGYERPIHNYLHGSSVSLLISVGGDLNLYSMLFDDIRSGDEHDVQVQHFQSAVERFSRENALSDRASSAAMVERAIERWSLFMSYRSLFSMHDETPSHLVCIDGNEDDLCTQSPVDTEPSSSDLDNNARTEGLITKLFYPDDPDYAVL